MRERAVMFLDREQAARADERKPVGLQTMRGRAVDALYFSREGDLQAEALRLKDTSTAPHATVFMFVEGSHDIALQSVRYLATEIEVIEAFSDWVAPKDPAAPKVRQ